MYKGRGELSRGREGGIEVVEDGFAGFVGGEECSCFRRGLGFCFDGVGGGRKTNRMGR